jgi:excisionase family DNA binding protein
MEPERAYFILHRRRNMQALLTMEEASNFLKISEKTLKNWTSMRKIPFVKVGRLVRFDVRSIEAWLKRREVDESKVWR